MIATCWDVPFRWESQPGGILRCQLWFDEELLQACTAAGPTEVHTDIEPDYESDNELVENYLLDDSDEEEPASQTGTKHHDRNQLHTACALTDEIGKPTQVQQTTEETQHLAHLQHEQQGQALLQDLPLQAPAMAKPQLVTTSIPRDLSAAVINCLDVLATSDAIYTDLMLEVDGQLLPELYRGVYITKGVRHNKRWGSLRGMPLVHLPYAVSPRHLVGAKRKDASTMILQIGWQLLQSTAAVGIAAHAEADNSSGSNSTDTGVGSPMHESCSDSVTDSQVPDALPSQLKAEQGDEHSSGWMWQAQAAAEPKMPVQKQQHRHDNEDEDAESSDTSPAVSLARMPHNAYLQASPRRSSSWDTRPAALPMLFSPSHTHVHTYMAAPAILGLPAVHGMGAWPAACDRLDCQAMIQAAYAPACPADGSNSSSPSIAANLASEWCAAQMLQRAAVAASTTAEALPGVPELPLSQAVAMGWVQIKAEPREDSQVRFCLCACVYSDL